MTAATTPTATSYYYNPPSGPEIVAGEGVWLYDRDGRAYLDCEAGTFNVSLGYGHPEVVHAVRAQAERLIHVTSQFATEPLDALARELVEIAPPNLDRVHLKTISGSTAVEGAIRMAQLHTGRSEVITLFRSHHGQTLATTGIAGSGARRRRLATHPLAALQVPDPYCYRCFYRERPETCGFLCVDRIDDFIAYASSGRIACVVIEPISGNGGNVVPPDGYLQALRRFCDEREIVLIFDEVQTGLGRTGEMFAADHFGVAPHAMAIAKGLGGSGLPIAAILAEERLTGLHRDEHAFTGGGNLLGAAAALATLRVLRAPGFLAHVREVGAAILERFHAMQRRLPAIGDVRGVGLMIGIELVDRAGRPDVRLANDVVARGLEYGVVLRASEYGRGSVIKVRPALVITTEEAELLCDRIERLLATATG
jgi:4-aminobutyrate aminotransferase-like enzyme